MNSLHPLNLGKYLCSAPAARAAMVLVWSLPSCCPAQELVYDQRDPAAHGL